jgi:hypothetical protein
MESTEDTVGFPSLSKLSISLAHPHLPQPSNLPLPPEHIAKVLKENAYDEEEQLQVRHATRARCCLVSKAFLSLPIPLFYEDIVFSSADFAISGPLLQALQSGQTTHVRQLTWQTAGDSRDWLNGTALRGILASCSRIEKFVGDETRYFYPRHVDLLMAECVSRWEHLETLELSRTTINGDGLMPLARL